MAPKKPLTEKQAAAKAAAVTKQRTQTRAYNTKSKKYDSMRDSYYAANPEKKRDIYDIAAGQDFGNKNIPREKLTADYLRANSTPKHLYEAMGFKGADHDRESHLGQPHLPGLEPEGLLPSPQRWEDFSHEDQQRVLKSARGFGVTPESASAALGATLDRANQREGGVHHSFYTTRGNSAEMDRAGNPALMPRERLAQSAEENGVPFHLQAAANAITSPRNKFVQKPATGKNAGEVIYPNDSAANHAIKSAQAGMTGADYLEKGFNEEGKRPAQGFPSNSARAIDVAGKVLEGVPLHKAWETKATGRFGNPKVSPFHDAWVDPMGPHQFWVSDVHSGAPAFAPHLQDREENGKQVQSDATDYMGIPGIHAFHDHIARKVMESRGLTSVTGTQSQHWSQEKIEKGHTDIPQMVPANSMVGKQFQGLFHAAAHPNTEQPTLF